MSRSRPVTIGIAGIYGYAGGLADTLRRHGPATNPPVRLEAVCGPDLDQHRDRVAELAAEGVTAYPSLEAMLTQAELEAVWLPVPIAMHQPFTEQVLAAGKAVMCEKPVAGTVDEVDAMIAARDRTGLPVLVGFQHIYDPGTAQAKRLLLEGTLGRVRRASVHGCWPRHSHYFGRTDWAGCIRHYDRWVLDSPLQNAMAHFVNLQLFLLGASPASSAVPTAIEAELYRAAPIENYDTIAARLELQRDAQAPATGQAKAQLEEPVPMHVLLTHACAGHNEGPTLRIEGERGTLVWSAREGAFIETERGRQTLPVQSEVRGQMVESFARLVRGQSIEPLAAATLEASRPHTVTVNGASEATPVVSVPEEAVERVEGDDGGVYWTIPDIARTFERCAAEGKLLHEMGAYGFTRPAGTRDLRGYAHFAGPHAETLLAAPAPSPPK